MPLDAYTASKLITKEVIVTVSVEKEIWDDRDQEVGVDIFFSSDAYMHPVQAQFKPQASITDETDMKATTTTRTESTTVDTKAKANTNSKIDTKTKEKEINNTDTNNTDTDIEDEDEHTLTAFGDISLSETDFVPGLGSALTPDRKKEKEKSIRPRARQEERERRYYAERERERERERESGVSAAEKNHQHSIPMVIRKVLPPGPKKSVRNLKPELVSFESMVFELKRAREEKDTQASADLLSAFGNPDIKLNLDRRLVDLKNIGTDAIAKTKARENRQKDSDRDRDGASGITSGAENSVPLGAVPIEMTGRVVCGPDERPVTKKSNKYVGLRGNAKLPKRPPLPRWEDDEEQ